MVRISELSILDEKDADANPHPPSLFRRESSEASRGGKRRNPHQSAVFGEAGNGTVVGIPELVDLKRFELSTSRMRKDS